MKEEKFNYLYGLKERIFNFIDNRELTAFSDLKDHFGDEFSGNEIMYTPHKNLIFWDRMNNDFINLIIELALEGHIRNISGDLANVMYWDVDVPDLPIACYLKDYKDMRWFPIVFEVMNSDES